MPPSHPSHSPHLTLGGAVRWSFTARIGRAHSDRARSASKKDRLTTPPSSPLTELPPPGYDCRHLI